MMKNNPRSPTRPVRRTAFAAAFALLAGALLPAVPASAQDPTGTVMGRVTAENSGQPLSGVQVFLPGTSLGGLTDEAGAYRITGVRPGEVEIRVQMIGYRAASDTVVVRAGGTATADFVLSLSALNLDEIVVTGTPGETQRRSLGNTVTSLDISDAQAEMHAASATELLNGRASGVQVMTGTGVTGAGPRVKIRGTASLSLTDQPLVFVDGVRVNNDVGSGPNSQGYGSGVISRLGDFSPDAIERIEVIKGPAAATLYGTEASNGVINIITKEGAKNRAPRWHAVFRQGAAWFHDPEGRVPSLWGIDAETGELRGWNPIRSETERGTPVWRTGHEQEYSLSVRGGSQQIGYFTHLSFDDKEGIDRANDIWRFNGRTNLSFAPSDTWDFRTSLGIAKSRINLADDIGSGPMFNGMFTFPSLQDGPTRGFLRAPPEVLRQLNRPSQDLDRFTGSLTISHQPTEWFQQRVTVGLDDTHETNVTWTPYLAPDAASFFSPSYARGGKEQEERSITYKTVDYAGTLSLDLSPDLRSQTSLGAQYYGKMIESTYAEGDEFTAPGLSTVSSTAQTFGGESFVENVTVGSYVQQQFDWKARAFVTGAVRVDNNSAFGEDFSFVAYPKLSASWVISEEPFWNIAPVTSLRLRGAFGQSGQQPDAFTALRSFKPITSGLGLGAITPESVGNPNLAPERGSEIELGFEAGLLDERIGVEFTFYSQRTRDAILLRKLAPSGGFPGSQYINVGELRNRGFELELNATPVTSGSLTWDLGFHISRNANEVLDVGAAKSGTTASGADYIRFGTMLDLDGIHLRHQEGLPAGAWFGKEVLSAEFDGDGNAINAVCNGGEQNDFKPVPCDEAPEVFLGRADPLWEGSFRTSIQLYDRLTLNGLVDFKLGFRHGDNDTVVRCQLFKVCRANHVPTDYAPELIAQYESDGSLGDFAVADASFAKLRSISLSYELPETLARFVGARNGSITVAGSNLATWTDWPSLDPETYFTEMQYDKSSQTFTPHPRRLVTAIDLSF